MIADAPLFSIENQRFNVIILAAGMGRRLKPETDFIPKALVTIGRDRAIDYSIRKFQYLASRMIIAAGYCADLLEHYVRGRYTALDIVVSREEVSEMKGPGASLLYALDYASSRLPTIVTFCDFIFADPFPVDEDGIVICQPGSADAVIDTYRTVAQVEEGLVTDIVCNPNVPSIQENGFTGTLVCHDTIRLKSMAYSGANCKPSLADLEYTMDIVRPYVLSMRTVALPVSRMFEFGTEEKLQQTRQFLNANL